MAQKGQDGISTSSVLEEDSLQVFRIIRIGHRHFHGERAAVDEACEALFHGVHSYFAAGLYERFYLVRLSLFDAVADCRVGEQQLRRDGPSAAGARYQLLRADSDKNRRELNADLPLLVRREKPSGRSGPIPAARFANRPRIAVMSV